MTGVSGQENVLFLFQISGGVVFGPTQLGLNSKSSRRYPSERCARANDKAKIREANAQAFPVWVNRNSPA
jgi:hypothetical protein